MKLKLKITRDTTNSELVHLGNFFTALGLNRGASVFAAPTDPAELDEGDVTFVHPTQAHDLRNGEVGTIDAGINIVVPEAPKRRRRTKAEIEEANQRHVQKGIAEAEAKAGPFYWSHPESDSFGVVQTREELDKTLASDMCCVEVTAEQYDALCVAKDHAAMVAANPPTVGNADPAPTPPATETPAAAPVEPAAASPSEPTAGGKEYTEAEVQDLAGKVARSVGPEVVKGKIAELGATRIAELTQTQRNDLGAFLVSKLP